jgi:drug/metabolite transporter (DMT)-like permease
MLSKLTKINLNAHQLRILFAFAVIYLVWGSTYVAIKFTLESLPPFLMVAVRFTIAGAIMYAWTRLRGAPRPDKSHYLPTAVLGTLLLVFGSTGVVLAERTVSSGVVSLLVATVPVYIVLLQWLRPGGLHPGRRVLAGLVLGMLGLALLLKPASFAATGGGVDIFGVICVLIGSLGSAIGALYARSAKLPASQQLAAGMEMLFAGLILFVVSACAGEFSYFQHINVSLKSGLALLYLIVIGSMLAYTAYGWLLKMVHPSHVSTYAYVNPVVAVFLGWSLAGEGITAQTMIGAAVILSAVFLISRTPQKPPMPLPVCALAEDNLVAAGVAAGNDSNQRQLCQAD